MEKDYKKEIYKSWGEKIPSTFPFPTDNEIKKQTKSYEELINNFLPKEKNKTILDLGCGYGFFINTCIKMGYSHVSGVEITNSFIKTAEKIFGIKSIVESGILTYLQNGKKYDIITAFDVLEHFKKEEIPTFLSFVYDSLNPNGIFIFRAPNAESLLGMYIMYSDLTHETPFTRLLINEIMESAGFKDTKSFASFVTSNKIIRLAQIFIAKIFGLDNKLMFSSNIIGIGKK